MIVEKKADGQDLELHTTFEDKMIYYKSLRRPWLFMCLIFVGLGIAMKAWGWGIFAAAAAVPVLVYQAELIALKKLSKSKEW